MTGKSLLRIGAFSRRVGMEPTTVRAWERRYGLPQATRTVGGQRLYDERSVAAVREARRLVAEGWSVQRAARLVAARHDGLDERSDALVAQLRAADAAVDGAELASVARHAVRGLDPAALVDQVLEPLLAAGLGRAGQAVLAAHVLASAGDRVEAGAAGSGPAAVVAAPDGAQALAVATVALLLAVDGWVVAPLGDGVGAAEAVAAADAAGALLVWCAPGGAGAPARRDGGVQLVDVVASARGDGLRAAVASLAVGVGVATG